MINRLFVPRKIFVFLFAVTATALVGACGGGGDDDPVFPNMDYTGVTTEAVITQGNADDFPVAMLEGSGGSGDIANSVIYGASLEPEFVEGIPDPDNIKKATSVITNLVKNNLMNTSSQATGVTESGNGNCGGSATANGNDNGSAISATVVFLNYCETDGIVSITLHGRISVYVTYDPATQEIHTFSMNIEYLSMRLYDSFTNTSITEVFAGSIEVDFTGTQPVFTMSVNFVYGGQIFKIANFDIDQSTGNISGKLYHPGHGYVTIVTDPLDQFDYIDGQFCNGTLEVTGVDISGDTAVVEFIDPNTNCSTYNICIRVYDSSNTMVSGQCSDNNTWGTVPDPLSWYTL